MRAALMLDDTMGTDEVPMDPPRSAKRWDRSVMKLNVPNGVIIDNIKENIRRHLPQLAAHEETAQRVAIVGGGWSLDETFEELRELYFSGVKLVALNGVGNWLMERNMRPSMCVVMDARPANLSFVEKPIPGCKYFLGSQAHPSLFDACDGRDVTIFHVLSTDSEAEKAILDEHYRKRWVQVPGAGTVGMVAVMLLRILGFRFQHLFGIDSCYAPDGRHHAYPQAMNDDEGSSRFWCAGREFRCSAWQASQAGNFVEMVKVHKGLIDLAIHGDGVLAHIVKTGARLSEVKG